MLPYGIISLDVLVYGKGEMVDQSAWGKGCFAKRTAEATGRIPTLCCC